MLVALLLGPADLFSHDRNFRRRSIAFDRVSEANASPFFHYAGGMMSELSKELGNVTEAEKHDAFEWLRHYALQYADLPQGRKAAIMLDEVGRLKGRESKEVSELHAAIEQSLANTDRGLAQFETLAETVAVWCESLAAGDNAPAEIWAERARALRAVIKESRAIEADACPPYTGRLNG
jgi:hypothetical protein